MKTVFRAALFGAASLIASSAQAQDAKGPSAQDAQAGQSDRSSQVEEIIVTAQRREQNLLNVPLAISAIGGEQLAASGIKEIASLQFTTPGFLPNYGVGYTQVFLRGIGNNVYVGADPSVATFVDDVPRIYGSLVNTFVNVERVEVLKGAQGGLYGRNATGGVVNIITRRPNAEFAAEARGSYGSKQTFELSGYVNVPLGENVFLNVSGQRNSRNPYVKNLAFGQPAPWTASMFPQGGFLNNFSQVVTGQQLADALNANVKPPKGSNGQDFWSIDAKLRMEFGDNFDITFQGDFSRKDDDQGDAILQQTPAFLQGTVVSTLESFGIPVNLPPGFIKGTDRDFAIYKPNPAAATLDDYGGAITANLHLDGLDITSISALRYQKTFYSDDSGQANVAVFVANVDSRKHYFYQELRAVSTGDGPFTYLGGVTYLKTKFNAFTQIIYFPPIFFTDPNRNTDKVENWSVYGQGSYDLADNINFTASARYIHETNKAQFPSLNLNKKLVGKKFLPAASLSYRLPGDGNIYIRYAKGWKAGGINTVNPPNLFPDEYGSIFVAEQVDTYEAGLRTTLFDRRMQLTTAIFYNDYKNLQAITTGRPPDFTQINLAVINAGSARTYGAEASVTYRVAEPLTVGVSAGYLNAKYKNFKNANAAVLNAFDFSGQRMVFAPEWQLGFTADLDTPLTDSLNLVGSALASYTSQVKFYNSSFKPLLPDPVQNGYWLVNARLGVRTQNERYEFAVFARNLFDKPYFTFGNTSGVGNTVGWGDPRIIGAEVRLKY